MFVGSNRVITEDQNLEEDYGAIEKWMHLVGYVEGSHFGTDIYRCDVNIDSPGNFRMVFIKIWTPLKL